MSFEDYKITDANIAAYGVQSAADKLVGTAAQNKAVFDNLISAVVKGCLNGLIDALQDANAAGEIGIDTVTGYTSDNLQGILEEMADAITQAVAGQLTPACILTTHLADSDESTAGVTTAKLRNAAVTEAKLAAGAVTAAKIGDGAVSAAKLADGAVSTAKIADLAVTEAKIGALAVTKGKIANAAVDNTKLAESAVTNVKIAAGAVTAGKLASDVTTVLSNLQSDKEDKGIITIGDTQYTVQVGAEEDAAAGYLTLVLET